MNLKQFSEDLYKVFSEINSSEIAFHTDMIGLKFVQPRIMISQQFDNLLNLLLKASNERTLLFPTFNYDFLKTGLYNVESDVCQVGAFNEHIRKLFSKQRTKTPVFNYCIINNKNFDFEIRDNPFSDNSIFDSMVKNKTTIGFLGADFSVNTFIHYSEEVAGIGYRYHKLFHGFVNTHESKTNLTFKYRVRPTLEKAVDYDWKKIETDLGNSGLLHKANSDVCKISYFRADKAHDFILNKIINDELYLLTPASKKIVLELYSKYGSPLLLDKIEKNEH